jgi:DNA-binding NarL/FixJ family response regulator
MPVAAAQIRPVHVSSSESAGLAPIRVLVVDDHAAVRLGVQRLLDARMDFDLIAAVATGREAIAEVASRRVDVAVLDYQLGYGQDGLRLAGTLKSLGVPPRVLIYSAYADAPLALAALVAGADGLLSKAGLGDELCQAIRHVARGERVMPAVPQAMLESLGERLDLTPRERALLWLLVDETPEAEIEAALGLTDRQLRERRRAILHALTGPAGRARLPWDDGFAPLDYTRAVRLRGGYRR